MRKAKMSAELRAWVHAYLERDADIVVPVKKLWNEWRGVHAEPSLAVFTEQVLADEAIEPMGEVDHNEGVEWLDADEKAEYERDMESMGFFSGPRVKLKTRELTMEHIATMITKHNARMEDALRQAMATMPDDASIEEEDLLRNALTLARRLRKNLREAGLEREDDEGV
jgi:hypothetical protein